MKLTLLLALSAITLMSNACQTSSQALSAKTFGTEGPFEGSWKSPDRVDAPPPAACPAGSEYTPITLSALDVIPRPSDLGFKHHISVMSLPDAMTSIIRIETCAEGETLTLQKVVINHLISTSEDEGLERYFIVEPSPESEIRGLSEALREGNPTKLFLYLPYGNGRGLKMGGKQWKSTPVAYFYEGLKDTPSQSVYLGDLEVRDPFAGGL